MIDRNKAFDIVSEWEMNISVDGDEFLTRIGEALEQGSGGVRLIGHSYTQKTIPFIGLNVTDESGTTALFYVGQAGPRTVLVTDPDAPPTEAITAAVVTAADKAAATIGGAGHTYHWSAMIGPPTGGILQNYALRSEANVCGMRLRPGESSFAEVYLPRDTPSLFGHNLTSFVPTIVSGESGAYSWSVASLNAARDLNQLCALLTVAWKAPVSVRQSPFETSKDTPVEVPASVFQEIFSPGWEIGPGDQKEIPEWAESALLLVRKNQRLADALASHHQGLLLINTHPSMALVAFVAAIEAVSQMLFPEERCGTCRAQIRISAKFRAALALVAEGDHLERLTSAYSPRSKTVHRGKLHGGELTIGALEFGFFNEHAATGHRWSQSLYGLWQASEELLTMALKGSLPPKRPLE